MAQADSNSWKKATAGTYVDARVPRGVTAAFLVAALALALLPFVGMLWAQTDTTTENRELAAFPSAFGEDGAPNWNILADLGTYFDDHFAYRNQAVTANARLRALLGTSATDQVVIGSDGWLYYGGTLPDYLGQNQLSERVLAGIAHNLALAQAYVENQGSAFVFALAPNKNSLDASHMPAYYLPYGGSSNFERLKPYLDQANVNYVDLFQLFDDERQEGDDFGYLKLDSHWNNRWALKATNRLLGACGLDALDIDPDSAEVRDDFAGDLQSMLYPASPQLEDNYYYEGYNDLPDGGGSSWNYVEGSDVTDSLVRTEAVSSAAGGDKGTEGETADSSGDTASPAARGNLLMFRDSFGNALLPFWASAFQEATFSKLVPYNLTQLSQQPADVVVVERAERHLDYLASNPPIMSNPAQAAATGLPEGAREVQVSADVSTSGSYWVVKGTVEEPLPEATSRIHVMVKSKNGDEVVFDPFWTVEASGDAEAQVGAVDDASSSDQGFQLYVPTSSFDISASDMRVFVS